MYLWCSHFYDWQINTVENKLIVFFPIFLEPPLRTFVWKSSWLIGLQVQPKQHEMNQQVKDVFTKLGQV